jgi:DNA-binding CsgD family transcriptional regulator
MVAAVLPLPPLPLALRCRTRARPPTARWSSTLTPELSGSRPRCPPRSEPPRRHPGAEGDCGCAPPDAGLSVAREKRRRDGAVTGVVRPGRRPRERRRRGRRLPDAADPLTARRLRTVARPSRLSRLEGRSDPQRWQAAVAAREQLEHRYDAAYGRFRLAEALLASGAPRRQVESALRPAHHTTVALSAAPLHREIELLARRGRLRLEETIDAAAEPKAPPSPAASFGLTQREAEVLALVAEGRTNRQIGQALFITPKTASIHVSRILAKLGVAGRGGGGRDRPPTRSRQAVTYSAVA